MSRAKEKVLAMLQEQMGFLRTSLSCLLRWNFPEAVRTDRELPLRGTRRPGGKKFFYEIKAIRPGVHARQVEEN